MAPTLGTPIIRENMKGVGEGSQADIDKSRA